MTDLPHGTVTFAFTDVEESTALLKRLGDGYAEVLGAHRHIVRDTFGGQGGAEIDTQGDAFFFAFERAREAIAAAVAAQRTHATHPWPPGAEVRMRVGLHTGEPTLGEEGYLGLDVVRAARLCGLCRGGQVLLSETTRALAGSSLPPGVSVFPLGERHLKDIDEPERIYELDIEGIDRPPAREPPEQTPSTLSGRRGRWEEDFERRVEKLAQRSAEGVLEMLEQRFGRLGDQRGSAEVPEAGGIEGITARTDELVKRIGRRLRRAQQDAPDREDG